MDHSETKYLPKVDHTPAELDEASRLLLRAADQIEKRGLACGAFDLEGRGCVIVTMAQVSGSTIYLTDLALSRVRAHFRKLVGDDWVGVPIWSDSAARDGRTHEVVATLRAVALGL